MVDTDIKLIGFDYVNSETAAEIYRNLKMLFSTLEGTCAGDRNYGIKPEYIDTSVGGESNAMAVEIIEKLDMYEPRVELEDIKSETTKNGIKHTLYFVPADTDYNEDEEQEG